MALFDDHGEDVLERLRDQKKDPFVPIVIINPIAGFPRRFKTSSPVGTQVTLDTRDRLQSFVMTDNDKKLDSAEMTFIDEEGVFADSAQLIHGAVIDVAWGYKGMMSQPRRLIARRLRMGIVQGRQYAKRRRGFMVTIEGLAPAIVLNAKAPKSDDIFEDKPLTTIVRVISERMGYHESRRGEKWLNIRILAEDNVSEPAITRPRSMTYPQFLQMMAERHGLVFQINRQGLFFGTRDVEALSTPVIDLNGDTLLGIELDGDLIFGVPAGIKFVGYQPGEQKIINVDKTEREKDRKKGGAGTLAKTEDDVKDATTPEDSTVVEPEPGSVPGKALVTVKTGSGRGRAVNISNTVLEDFQPTTATRLFSDVSRGHRHRKKKAWQINIRVVGNPKLLAGTTVLLRNFGTALLDGTWFINEARHRIENAYITELRCGRHVGTASNGAGNIIKRDTDKTARTKADKEVDFNESGNVEAESLFKLDPARSVKLSHDTSGTYKEHEHRVRGR
jgi:hypothetical protein